MEPLFCRQTLVNKNHQVVGYEFNSTSETVRIMGAPAKGVNLPSNIFNSLNISAFPEETLFFFEVPDVPLDNESLLKVPEQIVFVVPSDLVITSEKKEFLDIICKVGFSLCLEDMTSETMKLFRMARYIKLDTRRLDINRLTQLSGELSKFHIKQIATGVETEEVFQACCKMNINFIQGNYFLKSSKNPVKKIVGPAMANMFSLMSMVQNDAPIAKMEEILKRDAALSYKLLRYINSAGFGLSKEITSYDHAVTVLGYRKLYKWLSLLMVMAAVKEATPAVLIKTATIRGRLAELIGQQYLDESQSDNLFIAGLFSLLDVIMKMPMTEALKQINLSKDLNEALLKREGVFSPFIDLVEACEQPDLHKLEETAGALQLPASFVNTSHLSALTWVEKLGI